MTTDSGGAEQTTGDLKRTAIESILDVTSGLLYVTDVDALLNKIAKTVSETFGLRNVSIGISDRETGDCCVRATHGYSSEVDGLIRKVRYSEERMKKDLRPEFKVGKATYYVPGEFNQIENEEDMLYVVHPERMDRPRTRPDEWHELDYIDFLMYRKDGSLLGYLEIDEPEDHRIPGEEKLRAIEIFSDLAAIAIQNAELYDQLDTDRRKIELLLDLIGHDVNNYAQAVSGFIEIGMQRENVPEPARKSLAKALDQVWNLNKLVTNVKLFAKVEAANGSDLRPMNLLEVLRDALSAAEANYPSRTVRIAMEDDGRPKLCMMNSFAKEIFVNLVSNAIKFDPHEEVDIEIKVDSSCTETRSYWSVSVTDHGLGIDDSLKEWIFERFAHGGKPGSKGSSGLGLHIARKLVSTYKGRIWVEDRVQGDRTKGSVFTVLLPKAPEPT
ncbi:MAG: GAF domain-containing sensor histidine kinase [Candidatus Thermoplasmatota archaeon]|nr:GAF domain-containing sensor histidine kinase [Candidatus Thermoplasmatota archaeon]